MKKLSDVDEQWLIWSHQWTTVNVSISIEIDNKWKINIRMQRCCRDKITQILTDWYLSLCVWITVVWMQKITNFVAEINFVGCSVLSQLNRTQNLHRLQLSIYKLNQQRQNLVQKWKQQLLKYSNIPPFLKLCFQQSRRLWNGNIYMDNYKILLF